MASCAEAEGALKEEEAATRMEDEVEDEGGR